MYSVPPKLKNFIPQALILNYKLCSTTGRLDILVLFGPRHGELCSLLLGAARVQFKLCRGGKSQRAAGDALPHQDSVRVCDTRQVGCYTYLDHHYQGCAIVSLILNASKYLAPTLFYLIGFTLKMYCNYLSTLKPAFDGSRNVPYRRNFYQATLFGSVWELKRKTPETPLFNR